MNQDTKFLFQEEQRFRQPFLWVIIGVSSLLTIGIFAYGMYQQLIQGKPWGDRPMPDPVLLLFGSFMILFGIGLFVFFCITKLTTEVRGGGLFIRYFPFHLSFRKIPLEKVKKCEARKYKPIREYGGWGIRFGSHGKVYNVKGNRGVQFEFLSGRRLLIGSQKPDEFVQAIDSILKLN
jgi:hypothetical protein